jgi:hypothetical protein
MRVSFVGLNLNAVAGLNKEDVVPDPGLKCQAFERPKAFAFEWQHQSREDSDALC